MRECWGEEGNFLNYLFLLFKIKFPQALIVLSPHVATIWKSRIVLINASLQTVQDRVGRKNSICTVGRGV